jgi:hypothetical protein
VKRILASICVGIALITTPFSFVGCVTTSGIPELSEKNTDQVILRAEQTAQTARLTFTTFVHLERDNEAVLKSFNPQIHVYANTIRVHGLDWVDSLRTATKTFEANRTPENQSNLNTWILTLTNAIAETQKYIAQSRKVAQP